MKLTMLKGKIHRATVRQAELDYVGSITVDPELMEGQAFWNMKRWSLLTSTTAAGLRHIPLPESRGAA